MSFNPSGGRNFRFVGSHTWNSNPSFDVTQLTIDTSTDTITTATPHGFAAGSYVTFLGKGKPGLNYSNTFPGGLSPFNRYYVVNPTTTTFQLSTTSGGAAIDITSVGDATGWWIEYTPYSMSGYTFSNLGGLQRFRLVFKGLSQQGMPLQFNGVGSSVYVGYSGPNTYTTLTAHNKGNGWSYLDGICVDSRIYLFGFQEITYFTGMYTGSSVFFTLPVPSFSSGLTSLSISLGGAAVYNGMTIEIYENMGEIL